MRHQNRKTKHHIIPRSRGGDNGLENICRVSNTPHQDYHKLFGNMKPVEIIDYLAKTFWKGSYDPVEDVYNRENGYES